MSAVSAAPARTEEMAFIHRVFRHGVPMVAGLVRRAPPGATGRSEPTAALVEHLDDDEAHVVPLLRAHITAPEWERFGQETFEKFATAEKPTAT